MADKKKLLSRRVHNSIHLELYYEGGGEVPASLQGLYTDDFSANVAISKYLADRDTPKKKKSTN